MSQRAVLQSSFNAVIFSNVFIGFSAVTLSLSSYLILPGSGFSKASLHLLSFIFFSTLFVYNYYVTSYPFSRPGFSDREKWISENERTVKIIFFIALSAMTYHLFFLSFFQFIFLLHLGLLSMLYIFPVRLGRLEISLRRFPLLKIFVLTYVWSSATVFLPASDLGIFYNYETGIVFVERFIFILALAIPFDIRDYSKDKFEKVKTIPGILGISKAKNLSISLLTAYIIFSVSMHGADYVSIARTCSGLFAVFLIYRIDDRLPDSFYMFFIDGVMIFHFVVLVTVYALS